MSTSFHAVGSVHLDVQLGEVTRVHRVGTDLRIDWAGYAGRGEPAHLDISEAEALALFTLFGQALRVHPTGVAA
ncbi:MAG: hypothetical protein J2P17_05910 [Mycobacterium sp.]|nr:hypothetical protein [Mycobacterium sp.]